MSEGDVSLIRDEDLLRRMWQQTEDFSRKKEIRAHMYRLREERLRNLYSPEPKHESKGSEFTAAQDHVKSFADQSFESMKSKEVRDAGSPPKEFTYRGQDLKALSNAGWNVEQENKTTDDGRTHVKSINANIEGSYDVDGGKGQFAAVDHHKEAVTEYHDDSSSMKRNETSSNTAAREHVVRQTDDGTHVTSTNSSSTSSSKIQKMSSTRHESVPYVTNDDYDLRSYDTNRNEDGSSVTRRQIIKTNDYEQNLRNNENTRTSTNDYEQTLRNNDYEQTVRKNDYETGELVSRKVDYPDDNTRVVVETRCLPDGTRVTSTKREFRAPVQSTRAEQSYQTRSENRSYSTQQRSNTRDSSKVIHHVIDNRDNRSTNIVDSQRNVDDYDFKRQITDYSTNDIDDYSTNQYERKVDKRIIDNSKTDDSYDTVQRVTKINKTVTDDDQSNSHRNVTKINKTTVDHSNIDNEYSNVQRHQTSVNRNTTDSSKIDYQESNVNQRIVDHSKTDVDHKQTTQHVIRTHKIIESTDNDDYVQSHREINQRRYDTNDDRPERITIPDNRNFEPKEYKDVQPKDRQSGRPQPESYRPRSSQPRDTSPVESVPRESRPRDTQPRNSQPKNTDAKYVEEKIHNITRDDKVETIERKISTEERKTTYQTDFSQKKISNDWSPSHTAWASTLRGDTPSTTRPSTRASSPGSKTFRSSTSSLRSSVSPDKTYRKPLSRGSSPNKIDRSSPTRSVSDQHYTTHSTHSITEVKSHKYMTPDERRPPTGRHPSGSGYSPERNPQDHRQRPSTSPEKRPQGLAQRSSVSPDRKPTHKTPTDSRPRTDSPIQPVDRRYSPTRPQESPERKFPQHVPSVSGYPSSPSRSSISPEKTPTNRHPKDITTRPSQSPDRKPGYRKPFDDIPSDQQATAPTQPTDPTKILDHPSSPTTEKKPKDNTPNRESVSPDRKPGYMMPTASRHPTDARKPPAKPADKQSPTKHAPSPNPTRKPQDYTTTQHKKYHEDHYKFIDEETKMYTRTDKTQIDDNKRVIKGPESPKLREKSSSPTRKSPSKDTDITRKIPGRRSPSPKQHVTNIEKLDQVDTTVVTTTDVTDCVTTKYRTPKDTKSPSDKATPRESSPEKFGTYDKKKPHTETNEVITKSPSPARKSPNKDTDITKKVPGRRSPSPGYHVTTTEKHDRIDTTIKSTDVTNNVTTKSSFPKDTDSPRDKTTPREKSPSKFGTYDKKRPHSETTDDDKYKPSVGEKSPKSTTHSVSPTRKTPELPSPTKKAPERSTSPNKKTPRDSVSPGKSPTKSTKYTHTTDLLTSERTTEEVNKKMTKEHPRQLITPSSSPTRKAKRPTDTEPYTGQSSPTTSVSGFVYFSSPRTETSIVTDLDDVESTETHSFDITIQTAKRPENLEVKRSPSPSKIPCRSPSPERHTSPPKDSLPRKSSLKKPGTYTTQVSPVEKPPTSFLISPTEPKEFPSHKTVKKDRPDEATNKAPLKSKPPLERRETYEDRCRKILGMTEDTNETVTTQTTYLLEPATNLSSPSISPCRSPAPKDNPFTYPTAKNDTNSKVDVTDFITHEQEHIIKSTGPQNAKPNDKIPKSVRDNSPTKLQDIITIEKSTEETDIRTTKYPRQSPQRKPAHQTRETPEHGSPDRSSPERHQKPKDMEFQPSSSPAKLHPGSSPRSSSSPDRKIEPKDKKPNAKTSYSETTTTVLSKYDSEKDTEEITVTTDRKPSRSSESPTRKAPEETVKKPTHPSSESPLRKSEQPKKPESDHPKQTTQTKRIDLETTISMVAEYGSTEDLVESVGKTTKTRVHPSQPTKSPTRKSSTTSDSSPTRPIHPSQKTTDTPNRKQQPRTSPEKKLSDKPKDSSPTRPGYIETTTSTTSKQKTTTEDFKKPSLTEHHSIKPEHPSDKTRSSPDKEPNNKYPEDSSPTHGKTKKLPGYMKVTESVSSKYDTTSSEHDEKTTTLKTKRYHAPESMESPTRKASKQDVTEKVSDHEHGQKPSPRDTQRHPEDKRSNDTSPNRTNTEKTPHYMTPISSHRHTHEIETTTEDEHAQRKFANYTERHPGDTRSRDTSPHRSNAEKTPHYMTPISSHRHTHEIETTAEDEQVQRKFANYTERHPGDTRSRETSPHRSNAEKTPHYMTPISSHRHTHEIETTTEDEQVQRKFANYTERHPGDTRSRETSPHRSNAEKTPHYMTPISSHRHTHEIETTTEDEQVQRKFANYTERHPGDTRSRETSPHRSNAEKTPHYMTPISSHRHTHEIETTAEDEQVQRKFANYTERHPGDTRSRETSPHRSNAEKTPHYMTPISSHRHTHEIETTAEDEQVQRKFANYTERHPGDTRSRDTSPHRSNAEKTPHYMTPISSHRHTHEIETTAEDEQVQRKFANYTERHPGDTRSRETSPHRSNAEKTPHYMTPISSHRHTHEIETTTEDEHAQRKFANYTERHPGDTRSRDTSPHRSNAEKTPHYMTPISSHRHTHEIETTAEDEQVQRKFANYTERHPGDTRSRDTSPHRSNAEKTPHYMTPISSHRHTHEIETTAEDEQVQRKFANYTERHPGDTDSRETSPHRSNAEKTPHYMTPISSHRHTHEIETTTEDERIQRTSIDYTVPKRSRSPTHQSITKETPHYMKPISSHLHKHDTVNKEEDIDYTSTVITEKKTTISDKTPGSGHPHTVSPTRAHPKDSIPTNKNTERKPSHRKPSEPTEKYTPRSSVSPSRIPSPDESSRTRPSYLREPEKPRQLRTPSPSKTTVAVTEISTDFLMSEREQEILDRVHKSLRKLSPERKEKSPSRERSPGKTTTSLQDIDINKTTTHDAEIVSEEVTRSVKKDTAKIDITRSGKPKEEAPKSQNVPSKPSSRNTSPTKKSSGIANPVKIDSATKPRSISPKKPLSPTEQPPSPTVPKASGIKPKEQIPSHLTRKPTPATLATTKVEKTTTDVKRITGATITTKQNSVTKMSTSRTTTKSIPSTSVKPSEPRTPTPKGIRESGIPRKEIDVKVTRTVSDITMKSKKTSSTSPQRMKSKPEIQVSDLSNSKTAGKSQKSSLKEPQLRLPGKPKSATALNTPSDEDDIIIDVQQSKSSRENSPDRICPTPVNFVDDTETPRYPDEVKEPDDEYRRRTYHTIHETETIVDDIVEICEDDELFVRKSDIENLTEDESLLSVTDKVTKFTKGIDTKKPKDTTHVFKDTEIRVHSDFVKDNLTSDECLLSVSEKVNKFAKGPRDIKEKSPARRVVDEYDKNTVYTDDYTKLSVHDKAHLFVETAENVKSPKSKPTPQKVERPDLSNVDEDLKSDDCLLSVSDKVHKFVKTAEQFLTESHEVDEKEKKIKEQHDKIMKKIVDEVNDDTDDIEETSLVEDVELNNKKVPNRLESKSTVTKLTTTSHTKVKDHSSPSLSKPTERTPTVKITTLRSSEAVKKAKALFENIASTTPKTKDIVHPKATTKLTDIGVLKKSPKTDSTTVLHPSVEEVSYNIVDTDSEVETAPPLLKERPASGPLTRPQSLHPDNKPRASPTRLAVQSPDGRRSKSPMRHTVETTTTIKTTLTKHPSTQRAESPKLRVEGDKPEKVPGYLRPTKTSQSKEEPKVVEEPEVSSRRGSGKFGVELRRTSVERSTVSSERRRSVEHPCIEDIFDLDLLEQMLEKVVGYEQRRRIRAQIRIARKSTTDQVDHTTRTRTIKQTTVTQKERSPERHHTKSPERAPKTTPHKTSSPDRHAKIPHRSIPERSQPKEHEHPVLNGHTKESAKVISDKRNRTHSPEKSAPKSVLKTKSPIRPASPDKKTRTLSPSKTASPKPKANRFNEYASAYMKKVGLSEADKLKFAEAKKKTTEEKHKTETQVEEHKIIEEFSTSKHVTERTSSKDIIEVIQTNGSKRSPSPEKRRSPVRKSQSRERLHERTPSPAQKQTIHQTKSEPTKRETIIRTVYEVDKKTPQKQTLEEKPSWITNRNLKKITSETRTFSSKKIEDKPKYRVASPSKVITKPFDVITSSYGPGPLDAEGKPLFGIKALRNGASNYQVKGTVIRQEYHSRNGGEPEGTVSVTAYSSEPEELEQLLQRQGEKPSRIHGLAAITTTKKFGGDTGTTLKEIHGKEERAAIDQFTHSDRRVNESRINDTRIEDVTESFSSRQEITGDSKRIETRKEEIVGDILKDRTDNKTDRMQRRVERVEKLEKKGDRVERRERPDDKKTVRQSSVKSLTEKYIKNANESSKAERTTYPKAGLILRTATMKDSVSSDSSAHAGLARTDSEHSLGSVEDTVVTTERCEGGVRTVTTTTRSHGHVTHSRLPAEPERTLTEKSFLDSNTKVTGVQDILTRMKNADIVIQEGDTSEDMEARALLNKFLGATVLMAGMQSYVTEKPTGKVVVKQETVRSSTNNGGKVSSSQTRSVQEYDIDQCWDERLLRKLLDESKDYEQRRRLRARIRALMAEQEACASAVTEALAAAGEAPEDTNEARGESLLLPLLQGLLGGGGERLLAGLGAAPADVVADVRRSLARLRAALAPPAAHPQARALLALADRLEDALDAADRLDGCRQRRPRRRSRTARHTVGVTRGELDEARRLVDNDQLALPGDRVGSSATSTTSVNTTDEALTPERKQSVGEELSYHEAIPSLQKPNPIAHSVSYEVNPPVNRDAVVVEKRAPTQRKPDFYRHSLADVETQRSKPYQTPPVQQIAQPPQPVQQPQPQAQPRQVQLPQPQPLHQPQPAFPPAPMYPSQPPHQPPPYMDRRPSESKSSIAAIANKFDSHAWDTSSDRKENVPRRAPIEFPVQQKEIKREDKHTYMPLPPTYNFAAPPTSQDDSKPLSRFSNNSKRLRMKRANTIDIGRPLAGYRLDSEEDDSPTQPKVPEFRPQTENDRKFVAFMKKNEAVERETAGTVQANWSNRFGNIKHAFESREREDHSRSSSASSARRFWRGADEAVINPGVARPRKFLSENAVNIIKPPWVSERREPTRVTFPRQAQYAPAPAPPPARAPAPLPSRKPAPAPAAPVHPPAALPTHPPIPQSPTKPLVVKPFATRPIPVNQFSHAPMSAFKPPTKVASPTTAPANVWSPPSVLNNIMSPTKDIGPVVPVHSSPTTALSPTTSEAPWAAVPEVDKPRRVATIATTKFNQDGGKQEVAPYKPPAFHPPPPQTHALPQIQNYPMKTIPNQFDLSAPELVRKIDDAKYPAQDSYVPKVDAQRLQIEFYEKQIREKNRREAMMNGHAERKPPAPPAYTITDYTPTGNISTFVPLQRTPDIEKARAHKVDYLPDVVTNDTDRQRSGPSPHAPRAPISPLSPRSTHPMESPHAYQNGDVPYTNGVDEGVTTEHNSVVTRVMRGPVRGSATITTGVRTRNDEGRRGSAADSLRGALDKLASPKHDVIAQIERKKRETAKTQVRAPVHAGRSPLPAPAPPHVRPPTIDLGGAPPSPGALVASRESVSSESVASLGSSPLSRSGSWQHIAVSPKATSPRRVVARAKSMHLLAVPKLYEGGIAREEVTEKKRTVEAYFSREQQQTRPAAAGRARALRSAAGSQSYSLGRSRTMPSVSELQFLDESNTDDAFEDLVSALEEEEVTVTSSVRRNSSEKTVSSSTTTTKTSKVIESMTRPAPKPVSPFAKFRQLEKQNSTNSPNSASPKSPGSPAPYFKFTEPALQASAATIKERLLQWCRDKTRDYENVKLENFSTSWADGLAFCALLHHFLPDAFDYSRLSADKRRENFTLAFKLADEKAGIYPLLDVDDMVAMRKPDWKCVFTYVQSIHRRFKDE